MRVSWAAYNDDVLVIHPTVSSSSLTCCCCCWWWRISKQKTGSHLQRSYFFIHSPNSGQEDRDGVFRRKNLQILTNTNKMCVEMYITELGYNDHTEVLMNKKKKV